MGANVPKDRKRKSGRTRFMAQAGFDDSGTVIDIGDGERNLLKSATCGGIRLCRADGASAFFILSINDLGLIKPHLMNTLDASLGAARAQHGRKDEQFLLTICYSPTYSFA